MWWHGMVWYAPVWYGMVRCGMVCFGVVCGMFSLWICDNICISPSYETLTWRERERERAISEIHAFQPVYLCVSGHPAVWPIRHFHDNLWALYRPSLMISLALFLSPSPLLSLSLSLYLCLSLFVVLYPYPLYPSLSDCWILLGCRNIMPLMKRADGQRAGMFTLLSSAVDDLLYHSQMNEPWPPVYSFSSWFTNERTSMRFQPTEINSHV